MNTPKDASETQINSLWDMAVAIQNESRKMHEADPTLAARLDADPELQSVKADELLARVNPELIFSAPRRRMVYDRVPVGHDIGYRCYDGDKHSADSAFESGEYGDGLSENEAYADWLRQDAENNPKPRPSKVIHTSRFEPDDYASRPEPEPDHGDERDFDTDLEPRLSDD